jgi:hypothetical protein
MSYGGPRTMQHLLEYIAGTGVIIDGVTDATNTAGPWTFTVPEGVTRLVIEGVSAGGGGGGGQIAGATSRGGGGGGGSGVAIRGTECFVTPGATITITLGAAGNGGAAGSSGVTAGITTVTGLARTPLFAISGQTADTGMLRLCGGGGGLHSGTTGAGGNSGGCGIQGSSTGLAFGVNGGNAAASPSAGTTGNEINLPAGAVGQAGGLIYCTSGGPGGAASTVGTTNGAAGGPINARTIFGQANVVTGLPGGTGSQNGTISRGGGGRGGCNPFGISGAAGNASGNAAAGTGFGYGGSGGGADGNGSAGGPALIRIFYEGPE